MKTKLLPLALFALISPASLFAQPGSLDLSFDGDGMVLSDFDVSTDYANAIAIQSDGKIVVAGYTYNGSDNDFSFIRLNTDGTPDNSFDTDGELLVDFGGFEQFASAVAIQPDGKIVAVGTSHNGLNNDIMIVRLNSNGTLDTGFDGDGMRFVDIGISVDYGRGVAVQSDGKIVVVGTTDDNTSIDFVVMRLNTDGSNDNSFDTDGLVTTDIDGNEDYARAVAIQADGKIVVAGNGYTGFDSDFVAARYNSNGALDNTFNFDGKLFTDFSGIDDIGNAVAIHTDGTIVISGYSNNTIDNDFAVARYLSDGTLDNTFDSDGRVTTDFAGFEDQAFGCGIFSNGMIVVTGSVSEGGSTAFGQIVYETDGSLATEFDTDGKIATYVMNDTYSMGIAIQPDQKFVVCGYGYGFAGSDLVTARYNGPSGCSINTNVLVSGMSLTADAFGFSYQWVDCSNSYAIIPGETNQTYVATLPGTYAVIMTDGVCTDTSDCYTVDNCTIDNGVTQTGFTLTADASGLTYQWVDCNNSYAAIPGETNNVFTADAPGNYAVIITDGPCSDTSACFLLDDAGMEDGTDFGTTVFPNPTSGKLMITFDVPVSAASIRLTDLSGKVMYLRSDFSGSQLELSITDAPAGIYILEIIAIEGSEKIRLVKN